MKLQTRIAATGFVATAVTFGPGRMAYGMFLPQLREAFGIGTGAAGAIAGGAFAAFFCGLFATGWLTPRLGPRLPVLVGGLFAVLGCALTAVAPDVVLMSIGVALAAASAGFAWTPFNTMAEQAVAEDRQKRVLSIVSTGTAFGIIGAGLLASGLAYFGQSWRIAWGAFAATGLAVVLAPMFLLSGKDAFERGGRLDIGGVMRRLRCREALPLYGFALSFGASNGTYLSYWIDHISQAGGLSGLPAEMIGPVLFVAFGLAGCLGLLTGDVEEKIGLRALLSGLFTASAASLLLLAFLPGSWSGVVASAALQGLCVMALSAVYSFWSERLFPDIASASFTAVLMLYATGNVVAPPLAGLMSGGLGLGMTLAAFGGLSLASLLMVPSVKNV